MQVSTEGMVTLNDTIFGNIWKMIFIGLCDANGVTRRTLINYHNGVTSIWKGLFRSIGPLNQDNDENRYIVTIQCELSKSAKVLGIKQLMSTACHLQTLRSLENTHKV